MSQSRRALVGAALAIGTLIVLVENVAADVVIGQIPFADGSLGFIDAPHVALLHLCFASAPMLALALAGSRRLLLWTIAVVLTTFFAAYAVYQIWQDSLIGFAGGANIGLGLIMMASPFLVLLVVGIVGSIIRKRRSSSE